MLAGSDLKKGTIIGDRYQIRKQLGVGGGGAVYACEDTESDEVVAVKILLNRADLARFKRERSAQSKRKAQHLVSVLDAGMHDGFYFLVLELMEAGSLRDLIDDRGKLEIDEAAWLTEQIILGLKEAKTVHRDLKPENVLLQMPAGKRAIKIIPGDLEQGVLAKVADFGLAKGEKKDSSLTMSGQVMGTPAYMSPEQCRNAKRVSEKTDVYALGIMLVEMLTGKPPFRANNVHDLMAMQVNDEPKLRSVPAGIRDLVERCLEKSPGPRPTLNKLLAALRSLQASPSAATATQQPVAKPAAKKNVKTSKKAVKAKKDRKNDKKAAKQAGEASAGTGGTLPFVAVGVAVLILAGLLVVFRETILAWMQG